MLLTEWLEQKKNFTQIDIKIADYLTNPSYKWQNMSLRNIAKEIYVSPSTITRFCQKANYNGFNDFKSAFFKERDYLQSKEESINPSFPFEYLDDTLSISNKIKNLYLEAIKETFKLNKKVDLERIASEVKSASSIFIFSLGNTAPLYNFKYKMMKIGQQVTVCEKADEFFYWSQYHAKDSLFIVISYSGETPATLKVVDKLQSLKAKIISITSFGENTLSKNNEMNLYIATGEKIADNFGDYSISISEMYLLDMLYSFKFSQDFIKNYKEKTRIAKEYQQKRISRNSLLTK